MEIPNRILVDFPGDRSPAGYYDTSSDDDFDNNDNLASKIRVEPATNFMPPPKTLTATDISEEERRRYMRDTSMNNANVSYINEDSTYKTPNDTLIKNITSDPIGIARQVRHLHNRVKLLEEELQAQYNRQVFLIGFVSIYMISRCIKWIYK